MKPIPSRSSVPDYPDHSQFTCDRRRFLSTLLGGAVGFGLAARAAAQDLAKEAAASDARTPAAVIKDLAAQLGHEDFRKRKAATAALISLGRGDGKDPKHDAEIKQLVLDAMAKLLKHRDPEVANRARQIIAALSPKVVTEDPPEDVPQLGGVVVEE